MDFPAILVLATAVTGVVWALDVLLWAPKRRARAVAAGASEAVLAEEADKAPYLVDLSRSFFPVILIVLLIRSFVVEPFRIPSGSMMPTLLVGDFILVNKFSYGLRLPVLNTRILELGSPQRGEIVVFRYPEDPHVDYIKRVVGVPGDTVAYRSKVLYINGEPMPQEYVGSYVGAGSGAVMTGAAVREEKLDDKAHRILLLPEGYERGFEYTVGEGQYFVMGDNRDNSRDSRFWGTVPEQNLVGRAFFIWMNWDSGAGRVDWGRIGSGIK
ncbi:MAG: signal peptidase I [Gammaproteobacteria bacterium HGW-Gammaproteobacteria-1]|jgi:signal peptidase I|nr:MAG: signal peptidase I [Gammaproteobacteria bacterium HGW-Gammaproteobacteria-1]